MNDRAEITINGRKLELTPKDGDELKAALLRYLAEPVAQSLEDHAWLARITQNAQSFVDADGLLHVGAWLLEPGNDRPTLVVRLPDVGSSRSYYVAEVDNPRDKWWVTSIATKHVMGR